MEKLHHEFHILSISKMRLWKLSFYSVVMINTNALNKMLKRVQHDKKKYVIPNLFRNLEFSNDNKLIPFVLVKLNQGEYIKNKKIIGYYLKSPGEFCGAGEGRLWSLKVSRSGAKGGEAGLVTLDTVTGQWKAAQEYISLDAGIPSAPVVTNGIVYIGTSLNANRVIQIPIPPQAVARIKSWREVAR
jgi:hypothetical protein